MIKYQEVTLGRFLRILLALIMITISYFVLDSLSSVLLPFAVAWLLAYLMNPLVCFIQNRLRFKYRAPSIVAAIAVVLLIVAAFLLMIVPAMVEEFATFKNITAAFLSNNIKNPSIPPAIVEYLRNAANKEGIISLLQTSEVQEIMQAIINRTHTVLTGTVDIILQMFGAFITLLYMFFILLDFERLSDEWPLYLPVRWRNMATKLSSDLVNGMNQYFRGQALVALCVGVLFSIGFCIIDFPIAIGFGIFIGVLNLVPYLQIASLLPMTLLALLKAANTGENFWAVLAGAVIVMCVVQVIQDLLLVPLIMGKRMNLHPAIILLSLSVWGKLLGILGMIVALPLTTLLLGYLKRYHELNGEPDNNYHNPLEEAVDATDFGLKERPKESKEKKIE